MPRGNAQNLRDAAQRKSAAATGRAETALLAVERDGARSRFAASPRPPACQSTSCTARNRVGRGASDDHSDPAREGHWNGTRR